MTDPREEIDRLAKEGAGEYGERVEDTAPELVAALRAVLDLHQPSPFNENPRYVWCITCQTSSRALWPCETYQAITAALEAK